jgi:peptidoglycan/xylan/chitin deacetylase (PgdA/CDA1 family)
MANARSNYNSEPSYTAGSYRSDSSTSSGGGFCWKQFCCAIVCFMLLIASAAMIYIVVDGNQESESQTPASSTGKDGSVSKRNSKSGGKEGTVKSFNWCGSNKRMAVLTFDDGPSVTATPNVLADLKTAGMKATFFMSPAVDGEPDAAKCEMVKRVLDDGHSVQSHSWDHADFMTLSDKQVTENLKKNKEWLTECAGDSVGKLELDMFRPPYGSLDYTRAQFISNELGYKIATWNLETEDFRGGNASEVMNRISDKYMQLVPDQQGSVIILMHDKTYVEKGSLGVIPMIKKYFDKKGYEFGTAGQCYNKCDEYVDFCKMEGVWPGVFEQP